MTKNEELRLHALKCEVKMTQPNMGSGKETLNIVKFSLTNEEICVLSNALDEYYKSTLARKMLGYLQEAASRVGVQL